MAQKRGKTKKIVTVKLDDLTGGMNIAKSPEFIKDNEVVPRKYGIRCSR